MMNSNQPYSSVHRQEQSNTSVWGGMATGAGIGLAGAGAAYGVSRATGHMSRAGESVTNKLNEMQINRNMSRELSGKTPASVETIDRRSAMLNGANDRFQAGVGRMDRAGSTMFGSKRRMIGSAATGLLGGAMIGGMTAGE